MMTGTHEAPLVALSILLAICASYTALTLAGRVAAARGRARLAWLSGGSVAMGSGIWSMHFVAMLAFRLPVPISYDVLVVAESFLAAVGASAFALFMASRGTVRLPRLLAAGLVLGLAIFTMHYTGMAAVRVPGVRLTYDLVLVGNSLVIAVTAATVALWLFLWLRNDDTRRGRALRAAAAIVMGLAISGVHYTAMAAAHFNLTHVAVAPIDDPLLIGVDGLAVPVVMGAFLILTVTMAGSITDRWVHAKLAAAEAASRAKSEFLSRMSHELRTPLNAILGFGQLVELEAESDAQRENADQILKAGRHLLALVNEVLDITGIEAGRLNISTEPVEAVEVVREVVDLVRPLAAAGEVDLGIVDDSFGNHYVRADRQRLKQVLLNLTANAIKYNRRGGYVSVACEAGDVMKILVEDSGPGIAADKLSRLFTPFDRLGAEQTGVEGTGLGLTLSKRLAEAMGGALGVRSTIGGGTTFWIELPPSDSPRSRAERLESEPAHRAVEGMRRTTVLYVEDNLSNLALVQRILEPRRDVSLISAMQGGMALELARLHRPDLIVLDLHLPDIPGDDVLRQLQQAADCRHIPVVALSADATRSQVDRLLAAGARAHITQPLDVKSFMAVLDEVLDSRRAA